MIDDLSHPLSTNGEGFKVDKLNSEDTFPTPVMNMVLFLRFRFVYECPFPSDV